MILRFQSALSIILCGSLICAGSASPPGIGLVMTTGSVLVDGLQVPGTTAIFAGNLISSGDRSAILQFSDGTSAMMMPSTEVTVYHERSVLQHGIITQRRADQHPVVLTDGLKISGATSKAVTVVRVKDEMHFEVEAEEGESDVWTPSGLLLARIEPGKTLNFSISQAAGTQANPKALTLCADLNSNYLIRERTSNVTYELQGVGLDKYLYKTVKVIGTPVGVPASPSDPQLLQVSKIEKKSTCEGGVEWLTLLILIGFGGAIGGLAYAGGVTPTPHPVTPATP
jgi:hypothetical protein